MVLREARVEMPLAGEGIPVGFSATARDAGDVTVIVTRGSFTLGAGGTALRDVLHVHASKGRRRFVVDLAEVDFIDSFGIGELVRGYASVRKQGGELVLSRVSPKVYALLQITRLHTLFEIHADEQAALRHFA
jgi:anti-sigma B factor antagonist